MGDSGRLIKLAEKKLNESAPKLDQAKLENYVQSFLVRRDKYLHVSEQYGSPLYFIDIEALRESARVFKNAFQAEIPNLKIFYAMKSCSHPAVVEFLIKSGIGIDVSSGKELESALDLKAGEIIFSGPGKTDSELELAVENGDKTKILIDSFGELDRLSKITWQRKTKINAGVRITTDEEGLWRKFGIPLNMLPLFFKESDKCSHINLCGIQFHTSWNRNPDAQCRFIERLGKTLSNLPPAWVARIEFLDIGGGYWPSQGEWLQPAGTPAGKLRQAILDKDELALTHYCLPSSSITEFASAISAALNRHIFGTVDCAIFVEPGRWLSHDAIHILLTVIDKKAKDIVIADGGTNMIGWERFETDYFPVINLSQPELTEHMCYIFGSLCTPHDIWGYSFFGRDIKAGDKLLIPSQGAYTYSLRQEFIKPVPGFAVFDSSEKAKETVNGWRESYQPW